MADNFDYLTQQQNIAYRQELAKRLMGAQSQQGQVINGIYVPPSKLSGIGAALQQAIGGYLGGKAFADQQALDKEDAKNYAEGISSMLKSGDSANYKNAALEAIPDAAKKYVYSDPNSVGPTREQLGLPDAMPVQQSNVRGQPLPPMPPQQPAAAQQAPAFNTGPAPIQPTPQQIEQRAIAQNSLPPGDPDMSKPYIGYRSAGPRNMAPPQAPIQPQPQAMPPQAPVAQVPQQQPSPAAALRATQAPVAPVAPPPAAPAAVGAAMGPQGAPALPAQPGVPSAEYAGLNEIAPSQQDIAAVAAQRDQYMQQQSATDRLRGMQQLAGTKNGRKLVEALQMRQLENQLAPREFGTTELKNADGSSSLVAYDKRNPTRNGVIATGSADTGLKGRKEAAENARNDDKFAFDAVGKIDEAQGVLNNTMQAQSKAQRASELLSKYAPSGGVWSSVYSSVAKTLGNDAANELDMALKDLAFADLRTSFGGNPTEGERKAQLDVKASVERGLAPSQHSLNVLLQGLARNRKSQETTLSRYQGIYDQYRTRTEGSSNKGTQLNGAQSDEYNRFFGK